MKFIKLFAIITLSLSVTSLFSAENCQVFKVVNHLQNDVHLKYDPSSTDFCSIPNTIKAGQAGCFSIHKQDIEHKPAVFISFRGTNPFQKYDFFAEFVVTPENKRVIHEELLTSKAAYSWNDDNSVIYLCTVEHLNKVHTCKV